MTVITAGPPLPARCLSVLMLALACVGVLGGCQGTDESIVIGVAGPFSTARAESMRLGAELAVSEINRQGGVRNRAIELVFRDDSADADAAIQVANAFYEDARVVAVIGHLNSGATIAAAPVYNSGDRPLASVSPSASSPEISSAGPFTFRICPDDLVHGAQLAGWVREQLSLRSAAIVYENDAYGRGVRETFRQEFTKRGGRIESADPYSDALPSFEPYLTRLRVRGGVDALFIAGTREGAERMLRTLDSMGSRPVIVGGDAISGIEASEVDVEGVVISSAYLPDRPGARNEAFVAAYRRAYGDRPLDHRGAGAYDIVHLLAQAIDEAGTDRRAIRDYLAGVGGRTVPYDGVTGRIAFNTNGDVLGKSVVIGVVRNKRLVTAPQQ